MNHINLILTYFLLRNSTCVDINECEENKGKGPCDQICTNKNGSFACSCQSGYELQKDKKTCVDIDECKMKLCAHTCVNYPGNYTCECLDGYKKTGAHTCEDIGNLYHLLDVIIELSLRLIR